MPVLDDWNLPFTDSDFSFIARLARQNSGIDLSDKKRDMVYARLSKRVRALGLVSFQDYCAVLAADPHGPETTAALNAITTNLTRFFREPHHFDHFARQALPDILHGLRTNPRRLRLWSAGCSSGEEPYTLAMVLSAALPSLAGWDARILATDIDTDVLGRAAAGVYDTHELERVPPDFRQRFFHPHSDGHFIVDEKLRQLIAFKPLNLMHSWPMHGPFDAIFCRNVAIYFSRADQTRLFERMADLLRPNGYLYIGHSENLFGLSNRFQLVARTIYRRLP